MTAHLVSREDRGPVAVLTLNRPQQRNALSRALLAQLRDAIDRISVDESIRSVVLTGAGTAFCSGMDLKEAAAIDASPEAEQQTIAVIQEFADLLQRLHTLPKLTIAAVNGEALAGGAGLMGACDAAIAAETARIGYPEVRRGLVPAIVMHDLCRQIGDRRARELLLGGGMISAKTAHAWGLVNEVTAPDHCLQTATGFAESCVQSAPLALATIKKLLDEVAARPHDLRGAAAISAAVRSSEEAREGISAFVEKRAAVGSPDFGGARAMIPDTAVPLPWVWEQTVGSVLDHTAELYPDQDALVFPGLELRWSWRELNQRVNRVAAGLIALGVEPGQHVGIWSMNVPEWMVAQFAAGRIGAVLVNVNPAYRLHELEDALRMADVATLLVGSPFKGSDFVTMVESLCPESAAARSPNWSSPRFPRLKRLIALGQRPGPGWWTWNDLEQGPHAATEVFEARVRAVRPADVHNIQFTSGTTGLPKGAMLTHRNVLMNAYYTGERLRYRVSDRICVPVPFYHCFGCVLGTMVGAVFGSAVVVPAPSFDARATLAAIAGERCTSEYGVPTMYVAQLEHPEFARFDLSSLRTGIMSGAPCPLPLMEKVVAAMGIREICIGYGQTEASPIITFTSADDPIEVRVGTVGRPIPGLAVKLVDPATGREVSTGEPGELLVRGHCVMAGYYNNPEATARAIDREGWLHTGDLARCRDDGNYRIVGRSRELIIRGGENIYPAEVEEFLHRHPAIAEVAVAGLPDARYGEVVGAWVVTKSGAVLTAQELKQYCQGQIAHFKIPHYVMIVASLPRTVTGKIRKHVLREEAVTTLGLEAAARIETA